MNRGLPIVVDELHDLSAQPFVRRIHGRDDRRVIVPLQAKEWARSTVRECEHRREGVNHFTHVTGHVGRPAWADLGHAVQQGLGDLRDCQKSKRKPTKFTPLAHNR